VICQQCGTDNANTRTVCLKCGRQLRSEEVKGVVTCKNHGNRASFTICEQCLRPICEECTIVVGSRTLCVDDARVDELEGEEERIESLAVGDPAVTLHAGFASRIISVAIDLVVVLVVGFVLAAVFWLVTAAPPVIFNFAHGDVSKPILFWSIFILLILAYFVFFVAAEGQTLGKQAMRIAVVEEDGTTPTITTSFIRTIYAFISLVCVGAGFFAILKDPDKQAWHDRWAKTYVISLDEATERL